MNLPPETKIEDLVLPTRAIDRLHEIGKETLADLANTSKEELIGSKRFRKVVIDEIQATLLSYELDFRD
jgi:DNA-directed RNA polymerase alpha subunit